MSYPGMHDRRRNGRRRYTRTDWTLIAVGTLIALLGGYLVATAAL